MTRSKQWAALTAVVFGILGGWVAAQGQAMPTAEQRASLSVFGGVGGTYTGVGQGRNASMTFGTDYGAWSFAGFRPSVELRGTFPVYEGHLNSQRSILAGVRVEHRLGRFHPYANFLIGGGHINYINDDIVGYIYTTSTVYSPGVGVTRALTRHFSGQVDAQFQHWDTPVNSSGTAWAKQVTLAVTYRFDFNHMWKPKRQH